MTLEPNNINKTLQKIRKNKKSIYHRLHSIYYDSEFADFIIENYKQFCIIGNQRCGNWYINPRKRIINECYFKSTDGHFGKWDFSLIRTNFHLLNLIKDYQGFMIFDSTQKGKLFSDALSKTVPIWCCVINRSIAQYYQSIDASHFSKDWDLRFHFVSSIISNEEAYMIEQKLPDLVKKLMSTDLSFLSNFIIKPLRPIWISPETTFLNDFIPDYQSPDFYPVLCISTSQTHSNLTGNQFPFDYVQGAGDDEETWSLGLTPKLFWNSIDQILNSSSNDLESLIINLVKNHSINDYEDSNTNNNNNFDFIGNTNIAIGGRTAGKPPQCWEQFDTIVNCCNLEYSEMNTSLPLEQLEQHYLFLNILEGKKGQHQFFDRIPVMFQFVTKALKRNDKILFHCAQGVDRSVGMALCIIATYLTQQMTLNIDEPNIEFDKQYINYCLRFIMRYRIKAQPSSHTLRRINEYLIKY